MVYASSSPEAVVEARLAVIGFAFTLRYASGADAVASSPMIYEW